MSDKSTQPLPVPWKADSPTRRRFLEAAGVAAAGATLVTEPFNASAADPPNALAVDRMVALQLPPVIAAAPPPRLRSESKMPRPTCVVATNNGKEAITCNDAGQLLDWDLSNPAAPLAGAFKKPRKTKASYVSISKPTDGSDPVVLSASFDGVVSVWSLGAKTRLGVFDDHLADNGPKTEIWVAVITSDGSLAISGSNAGEIRVWDVATTHTKAVQSNTDDSVASIAFVSQSQTALTFLAGYGDGNMYLWTYDIATRALTYDKTPFDHGNAMTVNSIAVFATASKNYAITGSHDAKVRIWDLSDPMHAVTQPILGKLHNHFVWRVAASPNGNTLASVSEDHTLKIYTIDGTLKTYADPGISNGIMGVDFLNDNSVVVTTDVSNVRPKRGDPPPPKLVEVKVVTFT